MRKVATNDLEPGMKIARKVENKAGMVLLPEGIELTEAHISRLKKWGIEEIYVEGEDEKGAGSGADIVPDLTVSEDFIANLNHKFEKVLDDPIMQGIYNAVKSIASGENKE